jgi:hypothetical protein
MRVVRFARAVGKVECCADIGHYLYFPNSAGSGAASRRREAGQIGVNRPLRPGVNVFFAFGLNDSYQMGAART